MIMITTITAHRLNFQFYFGATAPVKRKQIQLIRMRLRQNKK